MKLIKKALASRILYGDSRGKREERELLDGVLKRLGLGRYLIRQRERPDFDVIFSNGDLMVQLACELTMFYNDAGSEHGSTERRFFELWKRFAKKLRHKLDEAGIVDKYGVLFFKEPSHKVLDAAEWDLLITELVDLCRQYPQGVEEITFPIPQYPTLSSIVHIVRLRRYPETGILWWPAHFQSGEIPDPKNPLENIIEIKFQKSQSYDWGNTTERWLIIVAPAKGLNDMVVLDADPKLSIKIGTSGFSRIILWDCFSQDIFELLPAFRKLCDSEAQTRHLHYYPEILQPFIVGDSHYPTRPISI